MARKEKNIEFDPSIEEKEKSFFTSGSSGWKCAYPKSGA